MNVSQSSGPEASIIIVVELALVVVSFSAKTGVDSNPRNTNPSTNSKHFLTANRPQNYATKKKGWKGPPGEPPRAPLLAASLCT